MILKLIVVLISTILLVIIENFDIIFIIKSNSKRMRRYSYIFGFLTYLCLSLLILSLEGSELIKLLGALFAALGGFIGNKLTFYLQDAMIISNKKHKSFSEILTNKIKNDIKKSLKK